MAALVDKLRAQRTHQADVLPDRWIKFLRPTAAQMPALRGGFDVALVARQCVDWNLTEADLLGPAVGSSDPAPFSADAALEVLSDRPEFAEAVTTKLVEVISAWFEKRGEIAKN